MPVVGPNTNIGLTDRIMKIFEEEVDMWVNDLYIELQKYYPNITRPQMHGSLNSLVRRGKICHPIRGRYIQGGLSYLF